jgi:hypothetical protein
MKILKKVVGIFLHFLGLGLFMLAAIICYDYQNINLNDYKRYENFVLESGVGFRYNEKRKTEVFYMKLSGLDNKVGVYRISNNYDDLKNSITKGDKVTIYCKPTWDKKDSINIDLIQIEKNGEVILSQSEYQNKYRFLGVIAILATLYMTYCIFNILKYRKTKNIFEVYDEIIDN